MGAAARERHYALGFLVLTLAVSTRRIAAPERMRFAGER
jgi:hypothetical protein